jgi:hypothetical protein
VGHFTLDNASNNTTFMMEFGKRLELRDIPFDYADRQISCFAHVINIACQHLLSGLTNSELADSEDLLVPIASEVPRQQTFAQALQRDPVALGRNLVRVFRSSGQRRALFDDIIRDGNVKGWFTVGNPPVPAKLRQVQLLRDVKTRWDSVYFMLHRLRELRPVRLS